MFDQSNSTNRTHVHSGLLIVGTISEPTIDHPLSTGLPAIDVEHQELVDLYHSLLKVLNSTPEVIAFATSFRELVDGVRIHFENEEHLMKQVKYPDFVQHQHNHKDFLHRADDFLVNITKHYERFDCWAVANYFKHWLTSHIQNHDKKIGMFVLKRSPI